MKKNDNFDAKNLEICEKSCIFAQNFKGKEPVIIFQTLKFSSFSSYEP